MDFKTTPLTRELEVEENLLPEFENLHFVIISENRALFDYTAYIEAEKLEPIDYKLFMRSNKRQIGVLAKNAGLETSELFFINKDGHILVAAELAFLFLSFINPEVYIYFNDLLSDLMTEGVAYSQAFIYDQAARRLPSDILQNIIKERVNNKTEDE